MEYEILAEEHPVFLFKLGVRILEKEMYEWRAFINLPASSQADQFHVKVSWELRT